MGLFRYNFLLDHPFALKRRLQNGLVRSNVNQVLSSKGVLKSPIHLTPIDAVVLNAFRRHR